MLRNISEKHETKVYQLDVVTAFGAATTDNNYKLSRRVTLEPSNFTPRALLSYVYYYKALYRAQGAKIDNKFIYRQSCNLLLRGEAELSVV